MKRSETISEEKKENEQNKNEKNREKKEQEMKETKHPFKGNFVDFSG